MRAYLYAAVLLALIGSHWCAYSAGVSREHDRNTATASVQKDKVQTAIDLRDQSSATARVDMLDYLRVTVPPIEIRTHDTIERIRVVYKYRAIPADCAASIARPQRVSDELNAARESANKAVSSVRRTTPIPDPRSP